MDFLKGISAPKVDSVQGILKEWLVGHSLDFVRISEVLNKNRKQTTAPEAGNNADITPAAKVLELLAPMDSVLFELRRAAKERPESQMARPAAITGDPWTRVILKFQFNRIIGTALTLHASSSIAEHHSEVAFDDVMAGLKFSRGFSSLTDVGIIDTMCGVLFLKQSLLPIWQGLQQHAWSDEQLARMQQEIARVDLFDSLDQALQTERAMHINMLEYVPLSKVYHLTRDGWILRLVPRGWLQQNKIALCEMSAPTFPILAARSTPDFLTKLSNADKFPEGYGRFPNPYSFIAEMSIPATRKITQNITSTQAFLTLGETACALERHWLAHGNYPGSLAELVPTYLNKTPADIINGQPLHYQRTENGKFILYSIGLDGKDDGGKPVDINHPYGAEGDWAWPQLREG